VRPTRTDGFRPSCGDHFLWRDFYTLAREDDHAVSQWLADGFERLGFTPPHPTIGEMAGDDDALNRRNRENFAKLWVRVRAAAREMGWTVTRGSIAELYLRDNPCALAEEVFVSPVQPERFLVRITPETGKADRALRRVSGEVQGLDVDSVNVEQCSIVRAGGAVEVIEVTTTHHSLFGAAALSTHQIEARLERFVVPLLRAIQDDADAAMV
jgi:hypothetical protein